MHLSNTYKLQVGKSDKIKYSDIVLLKLNVYNYTFASCTFPVILGKLIEMTIIVEVFVEITNSVMVSLWLCTCHDCLVVAFAQERFDQRC